MQLQKSTYIWVCALALSTMFSPAWAVNNAPADAAVVNLRTNCTEGGVEVSNCFTSIDSVDNWLRNVRQAGPSRPTLVQIGPGTFMTSGTGVTWVCQVSNVTLRGSGHDQTVISGPAAGNPAIQIASGCTNLDVQDLKVIGTFFTGVLIINTSAFTVWTNVEIEGPDYGWSEFVYNGSCPARGRHLWFSSRIKSTANAAGAGSSRAYVASCAESWFWGSQISSEIPTTQVQDSFALEADQAEVHLYGSNASVKISSGANASNITLISAVHGSEIHIHGTGLDVIHAGLGNVIGLYADATSHFHANATAFNFHITGGGSVTRVGGAGVDRIESPYLWGTRTSPPAGVTSRSGADMYVQNNCPINGDCSLGGTFPHLMVYRAECTGTGANQGPWFDTVTRACRQ